MCCRNASVEWCWEREWRKPHGGGGEGSPWIANWASKEGYHFFRATLTKIHGIKSITFEYRWDIRLNPIQGLVNWMKNKEVMTFWIFVMFMKHFLNTRVDLQISEWMISPRNFPFGSQKLQKSICQLWESKTCLMSTVNKCKIKFTPIYFDMGTYFYPFEQKMKFVKILYTKYMETTCRLIWLQSIDMPPDSRNKPSVKRSLVIPKLCVV